MSNTNDRSLVEWARRLQANCAPGPHAFRQALEAKLLPMIRCALNTGLGQPPLVRWVESHLPLFDPRASEGPDRSHFAGPMARVLSQRIADRLDPLHGRETVVGP
jgi:hypothetical protein